MYYFNKRRGRRERKGRQLYSEGKEHPPLFGPCIRDGAGRERRRSKVYSLELDRLHSSASCILDVTSAVDVGGKIDFTKPRQPHPRISKPIAATSATCAKNKGLLSCHTVLSIVSRKVLDDSFKWVVRIKLAPPVLQP